MKLPRDVSGRELAKTLAAFGYEITQQTGSHLRLTTQSGGEHHITVPAHTALKVGTLNAVLRDVAEHAGLSRAEVVERLFS